MDTQNILSNGANIQICWVAAVGRGWLLVWRLSIEWLCCHGGMSQCLRHSNIDIRIYCLST